MSSCSILSLAPCQIWLFVPPIQCSVPVPELPDALSISEQHATYVKSTVLRHLTCAQSVCIHRPQLPMWSEVSAPRPSSPAWGPLGEVQADGTLLSAFHDKKGSQSRHPDLYVFIAPQQAFQVLQQIDSELSGASVTGNNGVATTTSVRCPWCRCALHLQPYPDILGDQSMHVQSWAVKGVLGSLENTLGIHKDRHAGQMGSGIAQVAACAGLNVMLCDTSALAIQASAESLKVSLGNLVGQGAMSPAAAEAAALRIVKSTDIQASACRPEPLQVMRAFPTFGAMVVAAQGPMMRAEVIQTKSCLPPWQLNTQCTNVTGSGHTQGRRHCDASVLQALADSDFVVEAIKEEEAVKRTAFSLLDNVCVLLRKMLIIMIIADHYCCHPASASSILRAGICVTSLDCSRSMTAETLCWSHSHPGEP